MSLLTHLNPSAIEDASIEGIKLKDGSITSSKIDSSVASKKYVDDTIASAISASDAMVFKGTIGTGGTSESLPSAAIVGDTYKVIALTTIPGASSYTGAEETAKVGDLIVAISGEPKWVVVPSGDDEIKTLVQSITWSDLKAKRDAGSLIPGMQYRITDYVCTTIQTDTKSAGHQFDIIVVADDERTLNETARAINHPVAEGETDYFANNDLSAWQIWYCLDNDTTRFGWADSTNGKGVIYRMIDEWNNDVPYDFKNIMFNGSWGYWAYTFNWINDESDNTCEDLSVAQYTHTNDEGGYSHTYGNIIKSYGGNDGGNYGSPCQLNACIFLNEESYGGGLFYGCSSNIFGDDCYSNTFGDGCYSNTFGNNCSSNIFGDDCYSNTFGYGCSSNTFGNNCFSNIFGYRCFSNIFGNTCVSNTFGYGCSSNTFGDTCHSNTFGDTCHSNTFGNNCYYNSFGDDCYPNTFGDDCYSNTFGDDCYSNTFGNNCYYNSFGNNCSYIKFASDSSAETKYEYYRNNHFGDSCKYIVFTGTETASSFAQVQNYNFTQGLQGTSDAYLTINGVRNRTFETKVAKNSNGELKIYCEADLIR